MVASIIEFVLCVILLIDMFKLCLKRIVNPYLVIALLVLEFAIAVDIAIITAQAGIARNELSNLGSTILSI